MEIMFNILEHWGLGLLGALIYTVYKIWKKLNPLNKELGFSLSSFWKNHKDYLVAVIVLNLLIAISFEVLPETKTVISSLFSFDLENSLMGHFWLGWILSGGTNGIRPNKNISDKDE
jgi:hypothetical protein